MTDSQMTKLCTHNAHAQYTSQCHHRDMTEELKSSLVAIGVNIDHEVDILFIMKG